MDILFIGLIIFILAVFAGVAAYVYRFVKRIGRNLDIHVENRWARFGITVLGVIIFAASMSLFGIVALIVLLHFVAISMLVDVGNILIQKVKKENYSKLKIWNNIYKCCIIPLVVTIATMIYGYVNMMNVVETSYVINTGKDIRDEGYRIGLVADIHFGVSLDIEGLQEVCDEISSKDVDIMVLCGDIVDEGTSYEEMQQVFETLGTIDSEYGIYYVYGNHDRQTYRDNKSFTTEQLNEAITSNGIKILLDETVAINDEFTIIGRNDASFTKGTNRKSMEDLLEGVDMNDFILTLDHQPTGYEENQKAGTDLLLSGHTHAGQIWPANIFLSIVKFDDAVYGITEMGDFKGLVTSGVAGWGFPIKTSAPAEYVIIDVQ